MAESSSSRNHLLHAVRRILRPIIRVLIRAGVRADEFSELARAVYVESAVRDGLEHASTPTRTRVSVVTGVPRQQVDYYVDNDGALAAPAPTWANVMVEVLQKWHTDPLYVGPYGIPLELEFEASPSTNGRSFRGLVAMVDERANAGMLLEELLRIGSVAHSGEKHFRAVSRYFMMPEPMSPQQVEYFGSTLTRLAKTLEFNMNPANNTKRLERFVVADRGLPAEVVPLFERYARERTTEFLLDLDNWLTPYSTPNPTDQTPRYTTGVNVFLYVDPPARDQPLRQLINDKDDARKN